MLTLAPSGYSTELALWKGVQSLILGAPRHQHTGKVVLFTQVSGQWRLKAEVTGTQVECGGGLQGQRRRRGRGCRASGGGVGVWGEAGLGPGYAPGSGQTG